MEGSSDAELIDKAKQVLKNNDRGTWTVPAGELYPHQWLWDSCFISMGFRHYDIDRAKTELTSLLRGQWSNGMLPNIIFSERAERRHVELWRSWISPYAPDEYVTSGITQPPMLAEAVYQIGQKLKITERRSWYKQMLPAIIRYHEWLYADRDPHKDGLIVLLHPYEAGLDNSPAWTSELRKHSMPRWVSLIEKLHLDRFINLIRRDTRHIPPGQRTSNIEAMVHWSALRRLRRKAYNSEAILPRALFAVQDLVFNSILIRANSILKEMAKTAGYDLRPKLVESFGRTEKALELLWDDNTGQYYSRSFVGYKLIEEPSIATFMPLYSGAISDEQATRLVNLLKKKRYYSSSWPVPSVPLNSSDFDPIKYWQGPTWVNTNWLIIEGLKNYGFNEEAEILKIRTVKMVEKSGFYEYFNPVNAEPAGAPNFSWTAGLLIDLLQH